MENQTFKVVLVGILFNPEKREILIGKNEGDKIYTFLEGNLNQGEDLDVGLKRVTKEKTGYKIHNLGAVYADNSLEDKEILKLYFLCEATEGEEKAGEKVDELKWINPCKAEEIMNIQFPSRLKEYMDGLGNSRDSE
jgi:ADP-ribose pyrophosphatase YjhB (NUDIX family)